jgi:hypothetical protein
VKATAKETSSKFPMLQSYIPKDATGSIPIGSRILCFSHKNPLFQKSSKELKERGGRLCLQWKTEKARPSQNVFSSKQDEEEQFRLRWK